MAELKTRMAALLAHVQQSYPDRPRGDDDRWWLPAAMGGRAPTPEQADPLDPAGAEPTARRHAERGGAPACPRPALTKGTCRRDVPGQARRHHGSPASCTG